jgi:glycosyltransferase involved in cell wall biosynthesis
MAAGCPVIASNVSSLPEIADGCALLIDPRSTADLTGAILKIRNSASLRATMADARRKRAERFRWKDSAEASLSYLSGPRR